MFHLHHSDVPSRFSRNFLYLCLCTGDLELSISCVSHARKGSTFFFFFSFCLISIWNIFLVPGLWHHRKTCFRLLEFGKTLGYCLNSGCIRRALSTPSQPTDARAYTYTLSHFSFSSHFLQEWFMAQTTREFVRPPGFLHSWTGQL